MINKTPKINIGAIIKSRVAYAGESARTARRINIESESERPINKLISDLFRPDSSLANIFASKNSNTPNLADKYPTIYTSKKEGLIKSKTNLMLRSGFLVESVMHINMVMTRQMLNSKTLIMDFVDKYLFLEDVDFEPLKSIKNKCIIGATSIINA